MVDMKQLGESIVEVVKTFVSQKLEAVSKRLDALQERLDSLPTPKDGADGKDGVDGKSVQPEEVEALVLRAVSAVPAPKDGVDGRDGSDGKDGIDGKSVDLADVESMVQRAIDILPRPKDGIDGKDGASVTVDDVQPLIVEQISKAVSSIPAPKDGKDGIDGKDAEALDHGVVVKDVLAAIRVPEDGKSISPADVEPMLANLVLKAVESIPRPKDGESVPVDQVQKMIDEAVTKAMDAVVPPKDGRDGKDGEDGRDALEIDVLSMIDESKRYRRGTFASHKRGFWRAVKNTDGLDGWECIVDGVQDINVNMSGEKSFAIEVLRSSGSVEQHKFALPVMAYKGVFRDGEEYQIADTVTWNGSLWHANVPTKDKPIDGGKAWTLVAKRGRDGKDGRDGIDMTKAVKLS